MPINEVIENELIYIVETDLDGNQIAKYLKSDVDIKETKASEPTPTIESLNAEIKELKELTIGCFTDIDASISVIVNKTEGNVP